MKIGKVKEKGQEKDRSPYLLEQGKCSGIMERNSQ